MKLASLLEENIKRAVKNLYEVDVLEVPLEHPDNETFGDYATSVALSLSKQIKSKPISIAEGLAGEISSFNLTFSSDGSEYPIFKEIQAVNPGFVNFKISDDWLKYELINIHSLGEKYGSEDVGKGNKVIVEYSQPNTNKPQHIGHARNNFIGSTLANVLSFCGYDVIKANYVGDIGIHICKSMLMYKKYGENREPDKKPDHFVGDFYSMYYQEVEKHPELEVEVSEMLKKWEEEDPEVRGLWEKMNSWVYKGWEQTYKDQNVGFDIWTYESEEVESGKEIVKEAVEKGVAIKDTSGAIIAQLEEYGLPNKVLLRSDGTSVYSTKDLYLAKSNYEKYKFSKRLYVVDFRQGDYFKQIFKILELMGNKWAKDLVHISYGMVSLPEGVMSSRKGNFVNADDVFDTVKNFEKDEIKSSIKDVSDLENTTKKVALAAFRYGMLKIDADQDMVFDYEKLTKFEGDTGPYLMYTYARTLSVLERLPDDPLKDVSLEIMEGVVVGDRESEILRTVYKFPEIVHEVSVKYTPHTLARYLYMLSQKFNAFYSEVPILNSGGGEKILRLMITKCVGSVLKTGLGLMGIETVSSM